MIVESTLEWVKGSGSLDKAVLHTDEGAQAEIYQYGAHLTSWRSAKGRDWLFLSRNAQFELGQAIRGGVPVIFPQFNEFGEGRRHGFARNLIWQPVAESENKVSLQLQESPDLETWALPYCATYNVELVGDSLILELRVENLAEEMIRFTCALHTYLQVPSFSQCTLMGVQGRSYWDNDGSAFSQRKECNKAQLQFDGALDRVYFQYDQPLQLNSPTSKLQIKQQGFQDTVVWNPGAEAAKSMGDMAEDEWDRMVCIEAAQIDQPIEIAPGQSWSGSQILTDIS